MTENTGRITVRPLFQQPPRPFSCAMPWPVQLAEIVFDILAIEADRQRALFRVDGADDAEVAVEHVALVVVGGLHDLVARAEGLAPNRCTWRGPGGFSAACRAMLRLRAPRLPRFIGQST
jgi:hypothetical protein